MMRNTFLLMMGLSLLVGLGLGFSPANVLSEEPRTSPAANIAGSHLLDGKKYQGPTGEKGKPAHHVDLLSFSDGIFTSSACFQYGFKGGPYSTTMVDKAIHFQATTISPTHGKMEWQGTVIGDAIEVSYSWTKKRWLWTTFREYWLKGRLVE